VGFKRLLGIFEGRFAFPSYANAPPKCVDKLDGFDNEMFADFPVGPFTDDKPRGMRLFCEEFPRAIK